jgi:simple sugar transport system permease protein
MTQLYSILQAAIISDRYPVGAMGEIITEKSGNLNSACPDHVSRQSPGLSARFSTNRTRRIGVFLCVLIRSPARSGFGCRRTHLLFFNHNAARKPNVTVVVTIFGYGNRQLFGGLAQQMAGGVGQISVEATSSGFRATRPFFSYVPVFSCLVSCLCRVCARVHQQPVHQQDPHGS